MQGVKFATAGWKDIGGSRFRRPGLSGPIDLFLVARQNPETGEIRFEVRIPNAERISFRDDLGVLLQCFGWGMAGLGMDAALIPPEAWHDCCQVIWKVEGCLRLE